MQKRNRMLSDQDIAAKRFVANNGNFGIVKEIEEWKDGKFTPCKLPNTKGLD